MAKKRKSPPPKPKKLEPQGATLKDLLQADVVEKLKAQAAQLREVENQKKEEARQQAEAARKAEQKRKENDFEYLLNNSKDWNKYK